MLFYRAALPLSRKTLTFVCGIIGRHRISIGSPWRKLNAGQQGLLVLVYLRKGETFAQGSYAKIPYKGKNKPQSQKDANKAHAKLRSPGERANAQFKTVQDLEILSKLRCCSWRAGQLAKAIHVLQAREANAGLNGSVQGRAPHARSMAPRRRTPRNPGIRRLLRFDPSRPRRPGTPGWPRPRFGLCPAARRVQTNDIAAWPADLGRDAGPMEDNPSNEFPCKREGCTETVRYVPMKVPGALKDSQQAERRSTVVYLRCGNGHVHPYEVVIAATSNG